MNTDSTPAITPPYLTEHFIKTVWLRYQGHDVTIGCDHNGHFGFAVADSPDLRADLAAFDAGQARPELTRYKAVERALRQEMDREWERVQSDPDQLVRAMIAGERDRARENSATV